MISTLSTSHTLAEVVADGRNVSRSHDVIVLRNSVAVCADCGAALVRSAAMSDSDNSVFVMRGRSVILACDYVRPAGDGCGYSRRLSLSLAVAALAAVAS